MFTPNFRMAYETDLEFRKLLREDLVDVAYFEKFNNGRPFTLVENRKFKEFLRRHRDPRFDPRDPDCPSDPYDRDLDTIQASAGVLTPDGARRDPLFSELADEELERGTLQAEFGTFYEIYKTAYRRMRTDVAAQDSPLGGIHFDEENRSPGTDNIFDYMVRIGSLRNVSRDELVSKYGKPLARLHRVLAVKAQLRLLAGVHPILPPELQAYKLVTVASRAVTIDDKDSQRWDLNLDLSSVNRNTLASLTLNDVLELRKAGTDFFHMMQDDAFRPERFDLLCQTLKDYLEHLNNQLAFKPITSSRLSGARMGIRVLQGKLARHSSLRDDTIAVVFKIVADVAHSMFSHLGHISAANAVLDAPLHAAESAMKAAVAPRSMEDRVDDIKAHVTVPPSTDNEQVMQCE